MTSTERPPEQDEAVERSAEAAGLTVLSSEESIGVCDVDGRCR